MREIRRFGRRRALMMGAATMAFTFSGCTRGSGQHDSRALDPAALEALLLGGSRDEALIKLARELRRGASTTALRRAVHDVGVREVVPTDTFRGPHHILICLHAAACIEAAVGDGRERILPVLWAAGFLRDALEQQNRPRHRVLEPRSLPEPDAAARALATALDAFDGRRAEEAVAALCRSHRAPVAAQVLLHYGSRDFREIGHKIIHVVEGTCRLPSSADVELCYRSVAQTLALRDEAEGYDADGSWPVNRRRAQARLEPGGHHGEATARLLATMRSADPIDASGEALEWRARGASADAVLDAVDLFAAELMFNNPTSVEALHAVTSAHADRVAIGALDDPQQQTLHLLQSVARAIAFRDYVRFWTSKGRPAPASAISIESIEPIVGADAESVAAGFGSQTTADRLDVARRALAASASAAGAGALLRAGHHNAALRIQNVHDFKLATAVADVASRIAPAWRARYLAACSARLCGAWQPRWALADALMDA
jgi:hypothetical protein